MTTLLAIDTSSASTIVVAAGGGRLAVRRHDPVGKERPQHTACALPLAEQALRELGLTWQALERVGVGIGPGSFTGLRSGLSAAAGLARRLEVPLIAVTTTALLDHAARAAFPDAEQVLAVVDGRRRELFVERFAAAGRGAGVETVLRDELTAYGALDGWLAIGDGARLEAAGLTALGARVPAGDHPVHQLAAASLAALTAIGAPQAADAVRPAYGRKPDAIPTAQRS